MIESYFYFLKIKCRNFDLQYKKNKYIIILNGMKDFEAGTLLGVLSKAKKWIEENGDKL